MSKKTCWGILLVALVSASLFAGSFSAAENIAYASSRDEFGIQSSGSTSLLDFQDNVPPTTSHDYNGVWRTSNFTITLMATDSESSVNETYYQINDEPIKKVSFNGQPLIAEEGADNTLEYWSVDNAGNQETLKTLTDIKLDKTVPTGSITINDGATTTSSTQVKLTLLAQDSTSGVAQMRFFDRIYGDWESYATSKLWTFKTGEAYKTVYVQFKDNAGLVSIAYPATIYFGSNPPSYVPLEQAPSSVIPGNMPEKPAEKPTETIVPIETSPTPTTTPPSPSKVDTSFVPATIGIIIATAFTGLILVYMFRKRKFTL
jgi:hypothetical protein